jgi:hypothetical protein
MHNSLTRFTCNRQNMETAKWVSSVLNAALCSRDKLQIHHLLCFGRLARHPTPTLSLCCLMCALVHWEFGSLPHPSSLEQVRHSTPTSTVSVRLQFTVYTFQFCWVNECSVYWEAALDYFPPEAWVGKSCMRVGAWCSPILLQFQASNFGPGWWGEMAHFLQWHGIGRLSPGQRPKMSQSLILIDTLSSMCSNSQPLWWATRCGAWASS